MRDWEPLKDGLAWGLLLPGLLLPVANPDLFWHLETAERILLTGALPFDDALSFTRLGSRWIDFEWLLQLSYWGVFSAAGWWGLWGLKALLLLAAAASALAVLELHAPAPASRRAALLFLAALGLGRAELKPESVSVLLFTAELWALEAHRLAELDTPRPLAAGAAALAFFALWANLHPGFPMGWALLLCYAPLRNQAALGAWAAAAAGAALGTFLNPYGAGLHTVLIGHARDLGTISEHILEWRPLSLANPYHWPQWLLLAALPASWVLRWRAAGRPPAALSAAGLLFGAFSLLHARHSAYLIPVGLLVLGEATARLPELKLRPHAALHALWAMTCAAFVAAFAVPELRAPRPLDTRHFPIAAADFIERNLEVFRRRRLFNEWGWGGYLSLRFAPELRVFMDGRYIFHGLLAETAAAHGSPRAWQEFLDRHGVEWTLQFNDPRPLKLRRPEDLAQPPREIAHFRLYMPELGWALVYKDTHALIYARRGNFPDDWIARHEIRIPLKDGQL